MEADTLSTVQEAFSLKKSAGTTVAKEQSAMLTIGTFALFFSALMGATWWAIKDESHA